MIMVQGKIAIFEKVLKIYTSIFHWKMIMGGTVLLTDLGKIWFTLHLGIGLWICYSFAFPVFRRFGFDGFLGRKMWDPNEKDFFGKGSTVVIRV